MRFLILFALLFTLELSLAQGHLTGRDSIDSVKAEQYKPPLVFITFDPVTTLLNPLHPRWRLGYTRFVKSDLGFGIDLGYGAYALNFASQFDGNRGSDYQIWEVKVRGYKLYNLTGQPRYIGLELTAVGQSNTFEDGLYMTAGRRVDFESAKYLREKYSFNVRYGHLFEIRERVWIDGYVGLGVKYREVRFRDVVLKNSGEDIFREWRINSQVLEGRYWGLNFSFGINVLFRLK